MVFLFRYAQYGDVSPKIDVYAFGVVLYELISAKEAVVKTNETINESVGLVALVVILAIHYTIVHKQFLTQIVSTNINFTCWSAAV